MPFETSDTTVISEVSLADEVRKMITDIDELVVGTDSFSDAHFRVLARGVQLTLVALSNSMGECQLDVPYSAMHPVLSSTGHRWCCNHPTQHCS
jgi:hypothetical protein